MASDDEFRPPGLTDEDKEEMQARINENDPELSDDEAAYYAEVLDDV